MARIGIFGAGWVGLVTGACFAELGHDVVIRDVVPEKIDGLRQGDVPFHEERVPELLERNSDRLTYTLDARDVADCAFLFVCVDTPPTYSGDADLSRVWTVVDELPELPGHPILVMKSTVPVGTGEKVRHGLEGRGLSHVGYVSNPEFLAEGNAVRDFMQPDRVVVGAFDEADGAAVESLYESLEAPIVRCDVYSAEMIKLAANAFLMTRISFINEIANVCEATGADVVKVAEGVGLDHRLGPHFLRAGIGYGGSCLAGTETVLARIGERTWLTTLEALYGELEHRCAQDLEVLAWYPDGRSGFTRVSAVTRREVDGEVVEVRTKMGRRVVCTPDHPFVTSGGVKLAEALTTADWLPLSVGSAEGGTLGAPLSVLVGLEAVGSSADDVIVRAPAAVAAVGGSEMRRLLPDPSTGCRADVRRNGTSVPTSLVLDERFWRIVGLYLAEGHCTTDGRRRRLQWSFHPRDEKALVDEVTTYWRGIGVKATVRGLVTTMTVSVSSRLLAGWWLRVLGAGANSYEQRIPDLIWSAPESHKRALLSALWQGDGSWSYVAGGPNVVLEYGTVSRGLADGVLRLLGELGIVAGLKVGRTAKSTVDTYLIVVSGARQIEQLLDLVEPRDRVAIEDALDRQAKRIAPTGYREVDGATWVRVVETRRRRFEGPV
jgi:UDP-glucose 6-dehydrogenase